jgi:hypothetical protein
VLIALSDWAQVVISVAPAAIAGAVGYFGARLQYRVGERQRQQELRTARKEAYLGFLENVLAEIRDWTQAEPVSGEDLIQIQREGHARLSEIYLVGTEEVADAASDWTRLAIQGDERRVALAEDYFSKRGETKEALVAASRDAYAEHEERLDTAKDELIKMMRRDVGVDS